MHNVQKIYFLFVHNVHKFVYICFKLVVIMFGYLRGLDWGLVSVDMNQDTNGVYVEEVSVRDQLNDFGVDVGSINYKKFF